MTKKTKFIIAAVFALALTVVVLVLAFAPFGSGSPESASDILRGDGYTVVASESGSQLPSAIAPYVVGFAAGTQGSEAQVVIVFEPGATALESDIQSQLEQEYPSLVFSVHGTDMIVTGSESTIGNLNGLDN